MASPCSWTVALFSGAVANIPIALRVEQEGEPASRLTARYVTRPLHAPPYYGARVAYGTRRLAWELEVIHDKLYLDNPTRDVPHLEATHGYNYVLVGRSIRRGMLQWRAGAGAVLLHLEGTARGRPIRTGRGFLGTSYLLAAPAAQLGVGRPIIVGRHVVLIPEIKATGAYARVDVEGGRVTIPHVALHFVVGVGYAP